MGCAAGSDRSPNIIMFSDPAGVGGLTLGIIVRGRKSLWAAHRRILHKTDREWVWVSEWVGGWVGR